MISQNKAVIFSKKVRNIFTGRCKAPKHELLVHADLLRVRPGDIKLKGSNFIIEACPQFRTAKLLVENPSLEMKEAPFYRYAVEQSYYMTDYSVAAVEPSVRYVTFLELFRSLQTRGYRPDIHGHIEVIIGFDGTVKLYEGHHRLAILKALNPGQDIEVKVVGRDPAWLRFKEFVFETCQCKMSTYHQVFHPDFANWRVHYDETDRWRALKNAMGDIHGKKVLDIGVQMGYWAFQMAKAGADVVGVDNQQRWVGLCEQFNMVHGTKVVFHHNDFLNVLCHYEAARWDYGLFLNVLHWYIVQKKGDVTLITRAMQLLSRRVDTLCFSTGTYVESGHTDLPFQKLVPFETIPEWICANTEYKRYQYLMTDRHNRKLYLFSK